MTLPAHSLTFIFPTCTLPKKWHPFLWRMTKCLSNLYKKEYCPICVIMCSTDSKHSPCLSQPLVNMRMKNIDILSKSEMHIFIFLPAILKLYQLVFDLGFSPRTCFLFRNQSQMCFRFHLSPFNLTAHHRD